MVFYFLLTTVITFLSIMSRSLRWTQRKTSCAGLVQHVFNSRKYKVQYHKNSDSWVLRGKILNRSFLGKFQFLKHIFLKASRFI